MAIEIKFKAIPVNPEVDPTGGCRMQLTDLETVDESGIFAEVIAAESMPWRPDVLEFAFKCVLKTVANKIATDCNARKIGDYIRIYPELRGKIDGPYSPYNAAKCECVILCELLSGLTDGLKKADITFVNVHTGTQVRLDRVCWIGADNGNVLKVGEPFAAYGTNMQFAASLGDTAVLEWEDGSGEAHTQALTCTESDYNHMKFSWPDGATIEPGMTGTVKITSRAGVDGNYAQTNSKVVSIVAA